MKVHYLNKAGSSRSWQSLIYSPDINFQTKFWTIVNAVCYKKELSFNKLFQEFGWYVLEINLSIGYSIGDAFTCLFSYLKVQKCQICLRSSDHKGRTQRPFYLQGFVFVFYPRIQSSCPLIRIKVAQVTYHWLWPKLFGQVKVSHCYVVLHVLYINQVSFFFKLFVLMYRTV